MQNINSRYIRQTALPQVGDEGQARLGNANVLVIGAGGLGSPVLMYLAAAGVGTIHIVDGDTVSISNLNRQILYGDNDIGKLKTVCAKNRLLEMNSKLNIEAIPEMLCAENARSIVEMCDVGVLCLDSVDSRKIANRAFVELGKPYVEASIHGFAGALMTVVPFQTPCYECVYANAKEPEGKIPVLGAMAGWVGAAQALAVIRHVLEIADPFAGSIAMFDGELMEVDKIAAARNPKCQICGNGI
ncbi:MAG: HesA/MoeB/ThiF family protein [Eubacteriaceae bacterium]|nr:HesA/MoeB/ThiF family protein [Eubacteriaceae bacterium]